MSVEDINGCFGVPNGGSRFVQKECVHLRRLWGKITNDSSCFKSGRQKSNQVLNPVLRMVLKIISHSILSRKENTSVRDEDLFILHAMLMERPIDFCHLFLGQVFRQVNGGIGKVTIGGMLTPIATCLNGNQPLTTPHLDEHYSMDLKKLKDIRFLTSKSAPFRYLLEKKVEFLLPNAKLVRVSKIGHEDNMKMDSHLHKKVMERRIINWGEENEEVVRDGNDGSDEDDEESEEEEESHTTDSRVEESHFERLETRINSMESDFSSFQSTMNERFDTMSSDVGRNFTSLEAQMNNIAKLLENMGASQGSRGHEGPRPPPS